MNVPYLEKFDWARLVELAKAAEALVNSNKENKPCIHKDENFNYTTTVVIDPINGSIANVHCKQCYEKWIIERLTKEEIDNHCKVIINAINYLLWLDGENISEESLAELNQVKQSLKEFADFYDSQLDNFEMSNNKNATGIAIKQ